MKQQELEENLATYSNNRINKLEEDLLIFLEEEITNRELIQFKGFFEVKGFFKSSLEKFKKIFNDDKTIEKVKNFVIKNFRIGINSVEHEIDQNIEGVKVSTNDLAKMIQSNSFEESILDDLKYLNERLVEKVRQSVTNDILNGQSLNIIKKNIHKIFLENNTSELIAKTAGQSITAKGRYYAIEQSGDKYMKWWSVHLDDRTSEICKELNQLYGSPEKAIPANRKFKSSRGEWMTEPAHIGCRSRALYFLKK